MIRLQSIKIELWKILMGIIPTGYFIWTGEMHTAVFAMASLLTLDTLTGWLKTSGLYCGGFTSNKMFNFKKIICYMIAILLSYSMSKLPYLNWSFVYILGWLSLRETWSVMENLSEMGLPMPQKILKAVTGQIKNCEIPINKKS